MSVLISTGSELELLRLNIVRLKYRVTPGGVGGEDQLTLRELTVIGMNITSVGGEGGPVSMKASTINQVYEQYALTINGHIHLLVPNYSSTTVFCYTFYVVY